MVPSRASRGLAPLGLLALSASLRLPALDLRPLHHDEGSNAIFVLRLLHEGAYRYDPTNYHGPVLFYLSALAIRLFGAATISLRLALAALGALMAPLAWCLRGELGRAGALSAGALLAVSPSLVYYARDDIHETYFVAFTLLLFVGLVRGGREGGSAAWMLAGGAAAGALLATKETAPVTFGCLAIGTLAAGRVWPGRPRPARLALLAGAALLVAAASYSRLFTEPESLRDAWRGLGVWGHRALAAGGHEKPWWYFPMILGREEGAALLAGVAGGVLALRRQDRFGHLLAAWSLAALAAYSAIPYKTPWLVLNLILPLCLLAGVAFQAALARERPARARRAAGALLALLASGSLLRAVDLSFVRYDDPGASPLVYVQTRRDALRLVSRIEEVATRDPEGRSVGIQILSPDYLPLNWYLRDFDNVGYFGKPIDRPEGSMIIARSDAADEVATRLEGVYRREEYDLRPGVRLCLFVREGP